MSRKDGNGRRANGRKVRTRGSDLETAVELSFDEAAAGGVRRIDVEGEAPCEACEGSGRRTQAARACATCRGYGVVTRRGRRTRVRCADCRGTGVEAEALCPRCQGAGAEPRKRSIDITVPAAVADGAILRVRGLGAPGHLGGEPGDLLVFVTVRPHRRFTREGLDLHATVSVDMVTAALGGTLEVPLMRGRAQMHVPPGTQPGARLRLPRQGMADANGRRGDLLVTVDVEIPRDLTERQRALLRDFRKERHRNAAS